MKQHTPSSQSDQFAVPATSAASEQAVVREVLLAAPRGFCAGVDRAIDIVEHALAKFGKPIYQFHLKGIVLTVLDWEQKPICLLKERCSTSN